MTAAWLTSSAVATGTACSAMGQTPPDFRTAGLSSAGEAHVAAVVDGETLKLADGRVVRLASILGARRARRLAQNAARALAALARGKRVVLWVGAEKRDRYGRHVAHLVSASGVWLQGALLEHGHARVYPGAGHAALARPMYALETAARQARRGLWADARYAVLTPVSAARAPRGFQIVEGRVLSVGKRRRFTYLNYGHVWRRDFTVTLDGAARRKFRTARIDPAGYAGKRIRVRGWLFERGGPAMHVTHPAQIEVLD